ncbi:Ig-like domain-containing protein [Haloarchaeobius amylolyticus]|uniref:Ig-like domain-containing protein n=1 Tax=Haloarchaeobius amylolyticus TaxID=1198296 RepID=UPI00226E71D0
MGTRVTTLGVVLIVVLSGVVAPVGAAQTMEPAVGDSAITGSVAGDGLETSAAHGSTGAQVGTGASSTWESLGAGDWSTAGRDPGWSGDNPNTTAPTTDPDVRWLYEFQDDVGTGPVVVADGLVLIPGRDSLRAVDNETGAVVWNVSGIDTEAVSVADGLVVVDSGYDGIFVFDLATGTEQWNVSSVDVDSSVVLNGTVYVDGGTYTGQRIYAYDLATGNALWNTEYADSAGGGFTASGNTVYATAQFGSDAREYAVYALNASDGSERWRFAIEGQIRMRPVVADGSVFVGGGSDVYDPKFIRLDATDGHVEWIFDVNARPAGAAVANGSVFLAAGNTVYGLDAGSGTMQWKHRLATGVEYGLSYTNVDTNPPAVADDVVYVTNDRGSMVALDSVTGTALWRDQLAGQAVRPAVADGRLYVLARQTAGSGTDTTRVYALESSPFSVSGLTVSKTTVAPGEQFTVDVTVENVDDTARDYNLSLQAAGPFPGDNWTLGWQNGTLAAGATTTLTYTTQLHSADSWALTVKRLRDDEPTTASVTVDVVHANPVDTWRMGGFDAARTDANPNTDGPTQHYQEAWNSSTYAEDTTPAIANDTAYLVRDQSRYNGQPDIHTVSAHDLGTGTEHWSYNFTADNRVPAGSPAVVDGTVYVVTTPYKFLDSGPAIVDGSVYAFDAETGSKVWQTGVSINISTYRDHGPVVADGRVYLAGAIYEQNDNYENASVVALNAVDGSYAWSYHLGDRYRDEQYVTYAVGDGYLFATVTDEGEISDYDEELHVFDAATGARVWSTTGLVLDLGETPVVADGTVFVVNDSRNADGELAQELVALNVTTGAEAWRFAPTPIPSSYDTIDDAWRVRTPAVHDGSLYVRQVASSNMDYDRLYRVDVGTGVAAWNVSTNYLSRIQIADGIVYGGETTFDPGYTRIYDAETGAYLGDTEKGISRSVANGTLFVFDDWSGKLRALVDGGVIEYSNLAVASPTVGVDENATVTATVTNTGSLTRKYDVNIGVLPNDDNYVYNYTNREGTLAPGESTTVTWTVNLRARGDFVFTLRPSNDGSELDSYMIDRTNTVMVNVGDARDDQVVPLGEPRTLAPGSDAWPTHGRDARNTGNQTGTAPTTVLADPVNWSVNHSSYEGLNSPPTVGDGTVFVGGRDGAGTRSVLAYDAATGAERWSYATDAELGAAPTYASGVVYAGQNYGRIHALNASTGERFWTFDAGGSLGGLTLADDTLYVTADDGSGVLYALNATTREVMWTFRTADEMPVTPAVDGGSVYVATDAGTLYSLDASTGTEQWSTTLTASSNYFVSSPVLADGTVYIADGSEMHAVDATSGSISWTAPATFDGYTGVSPALANGTLYFGGAGTLSALDASGAGYVWNYSVCADLDPSPAVADGTVYVGSRGGDVLAVDATEGDLTWRFAAGTEVPFQSTVADGRLFVASLNDSSDVHTLYALDGGTTATEPTLFEYSGLSVSAANVSVGEQLTVSATVRNLAEDSCTYTTDFAVDGNVVDNATGTLGSSYYNDEDTVSFTHTFATEGTHSVTIADLPPVDVNVTPAQPDVTVSPSSWDYGTVNVSEWVRKDFLVRNEGTANLDWQDSVLVGANASEFSITTDQSETYAYLSPGSSGWVSVYIAPQATGVKNAVLQIRSDDPDEPRYNVSLTGTVVGPPEVTVSPTSYDFGDVGVGTSATANVTVTNDGGSPLSFDGAQVTGNDAAAYTVTSGAGATTIPAGGTHEVSVEFEPTAAEATAATLELATNDSDESTVSVGLSGVGTVTSVNRAPIAATDHYTTLEGEWLNVSAPGVLANDHDPDNDSISASNVYQPGNGTVSLTTAGDFRYQPDAGFTGTDSFRYRIQDSEGAYSGFATVTIEVRPDPNRAPEAIGETYSVHAGDWLNVSAPGVLTNDYDPDNDSIRAANTYQPGNGTLSLTTAGDFRYQPDSGFTGTDSFRYRIQDEHGAYSSFATVTIEVLEPRNRAPTAVDDHYSTAEGEWLNVSAPGVLANDYDPDNDSFRATNTYQPSHGTLSLTTAGDFRYQPDAGFTGTDSFRYRIQDANGAYSGFGTVTIEVTADNRPPTVVPDHYGTVQGQWLNISAPGVLANDYDPDNDSIRATNTYQPNNGTLSLTTAGDFRYQPDANFTGTDSFRYRIQDADGAYSGFDTVTIEVIDSTGTAPVAIPDTYTVSQGDWLNVSAPGVLANDLDPNGDAISASNVYQPGNGTVSLTTAGDFRYQPDPGFTGTDTFRYSIQDANGEYSGFATVTIEVLPDPNRAPVVVADSYSTAAGEWLNISAPGVLANDYDPDNDSVRATNTYQPSHGTLSLTTAGDFRYQPDDGFSGIDSFRYRIQDANGAYSGFGTVTIEVTPDANRAPEPVDDHYTTREGEWLNVSAPGVLANDGDPDNDSIRATNVGTPSNGTVSLTTAGDFRYQPAPGFTGTDSFIYRIQDSEGAYSGFATVTVEVLPDPNRAPTPVADEYVVTAGETLLVATPGVLANDYDADNDSIRATNTYQPSNGSLSLTTAGNFEYTPDAGFTGIDSFTYRIQDEHGAYSGFAPVTITVVPDSVTGPADISVAPDSVDFGALPAGTTETATVTVANVGDENLSVTGATLSGPDADGYEITAGNTTVVLGHGSSHTITVAYTPTRTGTADATLTVSSNDSDDSTVTISLTGEGTDDSAPSIDDIDVTGTHTSGPTVYSNGAVDIAVNVSDSYSAVSAVSVTLDSQFSSYRVTRAATYDAGSGNWTVTVPASDIVDDGRYDVLATATDSQGNRATKTAAAAVRIDREAPDLAVTATRLDATTANVTVRPDEPIRTGSLSAEVERPDGTVVSVALSDEGSHWNGTISLPVDGQYAVDATATDRAGNTGSDGVNALFATPSTDANNTMTVQFQPSGLFVEFRTNRSVNDTSVTITESTVALEPLVRGQTGVSFLNAALGQRLSDNLTSATIGIPVDPALLPNGTNESDVTIRYYNETTQSWEYEQTTVENRTVNGATERYWIATVYHFSTYGAVLADVTPPTVTATTPADGDELAAGTSATTLRVDYEDAASGVNASRVSVLFDDTLVTRSAATTVTSDYVEFAATGLADGSSHELAVTVEDEAGNAHTETVSFTVATANTGGGSGGSGGSDDDGGNTGGGTDDGSGAGDSGGDGGTQSPATTPSITATQGTDGDVLIQVRNASAMQSLSTGVENGELGTTGVAVDRLTVTFRDDGDYDLTISGGRLTADSTLPESVEQLATIAVTGAAADDDVVNATVRFSVAREALDGRDATSDDVVLYRLVDGSWTQTDHTLVSETRDVIVFETTAPGFATFVVGTPAVQPGTTPTETTDRPTQVTTTSTADGSAQPTGDDGTAQGTDPATTEQPQTSIPGFGPGAALVALVAMAGLLGRRRNRD